MNQKETDQIFGEVKSFTPSIVGIKVTLPGTKVHELLLKQIAKAKERTEDLLNYSTLDDKGHREHQLLLSEAITHELTFIAEHLDKDADYLLDHGDLIGMGAFDDYAQILQKQLAATAT